MLGGSSGNSANVYARTKTPALVLDSVLGIVWRCQNLQDENPVWVKTDLAKNKDKALTAKKYIIRMLEWPSSETKLPAIVLDIEEGKVWTCPDVMNISSRWAEKDLVKDIKDIRNEGFMPQY